MSKIDKFSITLGTPVFHQEYGEGFPISINLFEIEVWFEKKTGSVTFSFPGVTSTRRNTDELSINLT